MAERKGAIQMSLGLIVAVIFAVVFLSIGVIWIQGFMDDISGLTTNLIKEGKEKIRATFSETDQNFAVYPEEWELGRNEELKMVAGVINREPDSLPHKFMVNVIPTNPDTADWVNSAEFSQQLTADFNKVLDFPITINPRGGGTVPEAGTYVFYIIACIDTTTCSSLDDQNYESTKYVRFTLK